MVSTEQARLLGENRSFISVLYATEDFYSLKWGPGLKVSLLKHSPKMEKTGVYVSDKHWDKVIHSLSLGFGITEREDSRGKKA